MPNFTRLPPLVTHPERSLVRRYGPGPHRTMDRAAHRHAGALGQREASAARDPARAMSEAVTRNAAIIFSASPPPTGPDTARPAVTVPFGLRTGTATLAV